MPISRKMADEAHRTLGVRLAPNGSWKAELLFLQSKAKKFTNRLLSANLTSSEALLAYRTMFLPSMLYSAGVTWMDKRQCETLQKISRPAWLNTFGFNRNFPQAVAYVPRKWAGLGMLHHYHKQGLRGIFTLLGQMKSKSEVGKIVTVGVETFRLLVGLERCPLESPSRKASLIYEETDWFSFLHNFLQEFGLSIVLPTRPYMQKKCVRDQALMDAIAEDWSRAEL